MAKNLETVLSFIDFFKAFDAIHRENIEDPFGKWHPRSRDSRYHNDIRQKYDIFG